MSGASRSEDRAKADWLVPAGLLALGSGAAITPENARFSTTSRAFTMALSTMPAESKVQSQQRRLPSALIFVAMCAIQTLDCSTFNAACVLSDSMQPFHFCFSQAAWAE